MHPSLIYGGQSAVLEQLDNVDLFVVGSRTGHVRSLFRECAKAQQLALRHCDASPLPGNGKVTVAQYSPI